VLNFWLPIPVGGLAYLSLRAEYGVRERGSEQLRELAKQSLEEAEPPREWAVRHGMRTGGHGHPDGHGDPSEHGRPTGSDGGGHRDGGRRDSERHDSERHDSERRNSRERSEPGPFGP